MQSSNPLYTFFYVVMLVLKDFTYSHSRPASRYFSISEPMARPQQSRGQIWETLRAHHVNPGVKRVPDELQTSDRIHKLTQNCTNDSATSFTELQTDFY